MSLGDDLRQHGNNILKILVTVTLVLIAVSAFLDRNTDYNSSRDYLLMIYFQVVLFVLSSVSVTSGTCQPVALSRE